MIDAKKYGSQGNSVSIFNLHMLLANGFLNSIWESKMKCSGLKRIWKYLEDSSLYLILPSGVDGLHYFLHGNNVEISLYFYYIRSVG